MTAPDHAVAGRDHAVAGPDDAVAGRDQAVAGAGRAVAELVEAVLQLDALTAQVGPFALPAGTCDRAPDAVAAVCDAVDVPLTFDVPADGRDRDHAAVALAAEIARAQRAPALAGLRPQEIAAHARRIAAGERTDHRVRTVRRPDGAVVTAVEAGPRDAPAVLISPPCSLSYRLSLPWLRALRSSYHCVVVQTRGTTERITDPEDFDRHGYDVDRRVGDLLAVAGELAAGPVHVMGLCAGSTVALAAAARRPDLVGSLSLWHADVDLGGDAEKTDHQVNLRALADLGGESRDTAAWLRGKLVSGPMTGVPERIGPLVVRPYATTELFYRYAKLTAATMHFDSRPAAAAARQPVLVVTSADDDTAHPAGSRRLAATMPAARLDLTGHGTHLDAFRATPEQTGRLTSFLAGA